MIFFCFALSTDGTVCCYLQMLHGNIKRFYKPIVRKFARFEILYKIHTFTHREFYDGNESRQALANLAVF